MRALLLEPGLLTGDHLAGRRARRVPPLRLYLTCSVIYFLLHPVLAGITARSHPAMAAGCSTPLELQVTALRIGITPATQGDSAALAALDTTTFAGRLVKHLDRVLCNPEPFTQAFLSALPKLVFLLVPLFALLMQLVYRDLHWSYAAHVVFAFHFHAMVFLVLIASDMLGAVAAALLSDRGITALGIAVAVCGLAFTSWHYYRGARYVYGGAAWATLWKTTAAGVLYAVAFGAAVSVLALALILR